MTTLYRLAILSDAAFAKITKKLRRDMPAREIP
jgi:hypothetical protein